MRPHWWCCLHWAATWQNQQNGMCAQRRLGSAWASAQSDQSLRCPYDETLDRQLPIERTAKTLVRQGGCPGWSESLLGAHSLCWFYHVAAHIDFLFFFPLFFVWSRLSDLYLETRVLRLLSFWSDARTINCVGNGKTILTRQNRTTADILLAIFVRTLLHWRLIK